jgi:acyl phosphate:glycerol-3-phosphate acyltransferase
MAVVIWIGLLALAYLLGSLPTGYLLAKQLKGIDIRQQGSGSMGATNILRTLGKGPAIFVLVVDVIKGAIAVLLLRHFATSLPVWTAPDLGSAIIRSTEICIPLVPVWNTPDWGAALGGLLAVLGHSRPIWFKFSTGGKSVATGLGAILALSPIVALGTITTFGLTIAISRIVSISSVLAAAIVPILMLALGQPLPSQLFGLAAGLYVIIRHRSNMQRLIAGTEPRIGAKVKAGE